MSAEKVMERMIRRDMILAIARILDEFGTDYQRDVFRFCYLAPGNARELERLSRSEELYSDLVGWFRDNMLKEEEACND